MQRLTLAGGIPEILKGSIVALGNFDGFHLGHQAVVGRAVARGFHERRPVIVATFDPHPVRFFKPALPPFRLTTLDQREELFRHAGADAMLVFEFGPGLAQMDAEEFIADVLSARIGAGLAMQGARARGDQGWTTPEKMAAATWEQRTRTLNEAGEEIELRTKGRHDPCVGIRAVPVVEAMVACVLADAFLRHRGQAG